MIIKYALPYLSVPSKWWHHVCISRSVLIAYSNFIFRSWFYAELTGSYVNLFLMLAILYLLYKILRGDGDSGPSTPPPPPVPPLKRQDFTLQQLRPYDGTGEHGRYVLVLSI